MNRLIVLLFVQAAAQSPGNGISKSTYSCNDPLAAKAFLVKYFPVETPGAECSGDICTCSSTSSVPEWYIQQGRVYVKEASATGEGRRLQSPGNGFGLHCVNVSNHLTTGGLSTAEVEDHFTTKLGNMTEFDSFMDFSVTFYTSGVAAYAAAFDKDKVPYYTTTSQDDNGASYTSLIVRVAKTTMIVELTSKKSLLLGETQRAVHYANPSERRVSARAAAMIAELEQKSLVTGASLTPLSVNRAVSASVLAKLDDFYVTGMGTKKVSDHTDAANGYTRKCYLWSGSTVDICFISRDTTATKGDWKVVDFENMLNAVHKNIIVGYPFCGVDKWEDNHYAIDSMSADTSTIVAYINKNNVPHICEASSGSGGSGLHYAFDPTGWGIQLDLSFSTNPTDCNTISQKSLRGLQGTYNPACEPGTCADHLTKPTSVIV